MEDHFTKPLQGALFRKFRVEITNIPDDLDMGEMGMERKVLKRGITCKLHNETTLDANSSVMGVVERLERKMVPWSAQISEYIEVRTMPLNWRKERSHGQLGATLTLLGKMRRHH